MGNFKVGQWVRALVNWGSIEKGKVYQIPHLDDDGEPWFTPDGSGGWTDYLSLDEIEPWTPCVGERVRVVYGRSWDGEGDVYRNDGSFIFVVMKTGASAGANGGFRISEIEPISAEALPAKLQIEAGKFYKTRDGRKVGPMEQSWGAWRDATRRLTSQSWSANGTFIAGLVSNLDLISEWVEPASNDNAPVVEYPAAKPAKFKVGDVVTPSHGHSKATATVTRSNDDNDIHVKWNGGECGSITGWQAWELSLVTPATPTPTAIVALVENGKPKPADRPHVHASAELAAKEADRLANKFKGKQFGVYVLSSISEQAKPVYDHKWQRLAADGLKIDAIKELRGITGMGLKPAKDAVEYFLQAA